MADQLEASVTLPSEPASVSAARRHAARALTAWGLPEESETADAVRLIVSELATNAVEHTHGRSPTFRVRLVLYRDERLWIGVTDSHPRLPRRLPAAVQQDNGRGLVIIRWLTAERGGRLRVRRIRGGGKTVAVELPWVDTGVSGAPMGERSSMRPPTRPSTGSSEQPSAQPSGRPSALPAGQTSEQSPGRPCEEPAGRPCEEPAEGLPTQSSARPSVRLPGESSAPSAGALPASGARDS